MYNICLDTQFENNQWEFINCYYENGHLISTNKVFGVKQKLILPNLTKLYYRFTYNCKTPNIREVTLGIQTNNILESERKVPKQNKKQNISLIDTPKEKEIYLHLIFESTQEENKVEIKHPLLIDIIKLKQSSRLKYFLDKDINYLSGYSYKNILPSEFIIEDSIKGKIGSILSGIEHKEIDIEAKFNENTYYLVKLDIEEINKYGNIYLQYGFIKSIQKDNQIYLIFKSDKRYKLKLIFEPKEKLDYQINIKRILLIDITELNLMKEDILYLPFI